VVTFVYKFAVCRSSPKQISDERIAMSAANFSRLICKRKIFVRTERRTSCFMMFEREVLRIFGPKGYDMIQVKVKLHLCFFLTEHHAMKAYWLSGGTAPRIL
jgi:hypothetical protein